jgi:serine protease Do
MNRWSVCLLCGATFLAGAVIGGRGERWHCSQLVLAQGPVLGAPDRAYGDAQSVRTPLQDSSELLARIARLTTNSVVHIQNKRETLRGRLVEETGSGVIMENPKSKGVFVVSNRHVVEGTNLNQVSIHLHDGRVLHPTRVLTDRHTDVAILQVSATNLPAARWGDSDKAEIGHLVLAMGSPFGLSQSVTLGIISAKGRRSLKLGDDSSSGILNQDFLQTDAAINPGNSGGPLIDMQGQVIGINTAIASNSGGNEGIGFSIPSNLVRRIAEQLLDHGKVTRAYLGVKLDPDFNATAAARLKLDRIRGARVVEVYPNSPASRANFQRDDVVLTFDGVEVLDENHLINLVSLLPVGKQAKVVLFRDGRHLTLDVTVSERSDSNERSEAPAAPGQGTHLDSLGLTLHTLEPELASQLGYDPVVKGLLVLRVDHNGPMDGDIQLYDLIEEVARTPVATISDLQSVLAANATSDAVVMTVKRRHRGQTQSQVVVFRR